MGAPEEDVDYYSFLGVAPDASSSTIQKAYRRLAATFHPDKFVKSQQKSDAEERFKCVREAYRVLGDRNRRELYDRFGSVTLNKMDSMSLANTTDGPDVWVRRMLRTQRGAYYNYLSHRVSSSGSMTASLDATSWPPRVPRLAAIRTSQSWVYPFSRDHTTALEISGSLSSQEGASAAGARDGSLRAQLTHVTSHNLTLSAGPEISGAGTSFRLGAKHVTPSGVMQKMALKFGSPFEYPVLKTKLQCALSDRVSAAIKYTAAAHDPAASVEIWRSSAATRKQAEERWRETRLEMIERCFFSEWEASAKVRATSAALDITFRVTRMLNARTVLSVEARGSSHAIVLGGERLRRLHPSRMTIAYAILPSWQLTCFLERKISQLSKWLVGFSATSQGLYASVGLSRFGQTFMVPITIAPSPNSLAALVAMLVPFSLGAAIQYFVLEPKRRRKIEQRENEKRRSLVKRRQRAMEKAMTDVDLIRAEVDRKLEEEVKINGLVILSARYGRVAGDRGRSGPAALDPDLPEEAPTLGGGSSDDEEFAYWAAADVVEDTKSVDVTIPLRYMVQGSKLIISAECNKSNLFGFYDPCPGEEKELVVCYLFQTLIHEVVSGEHETLRIPMRSHMVNKVED